MLQFTRPLARENADRRIVEPRMPLFAWLASVPPIAVGMSSSGMAAALSIAIGISVPCLLAFATYRPGHNYVLPLCFGLLFIAVVGLLRFNSLAFVVDAWTTLLMTVTTIPRSRSTIASGAGSAYVLADAG